MIDNDPKTEQIKSDSEGIRYYPLTHPQKEIWNIEKAYTATSFGNVAGTLWIRRKIDTELLEKAINIVIAKNDSFRIKIIEENGLPKQYISEYSYYKIQVIDFGQKSRDDFHKWEKEQTSQPIDIDNNGLFFFAIFKFSEEEYGLYIRIHHLVSDAWSMILFVNQMLEYYDILQNHKPISELSRPSYTGYILNEEEYLAGERCQKDQAFWQEKFSTLPEMTLFKPQMAQYFDLKAERKSFVLDPELSKIIQSFCNSAKISVFVFFTALVSIYLSRITLKDDLVLGTPILNRSNQKEKETCGMFISVIPVRLKLDAELPFAVYLREVAKNMLACLKHQKYPYDLIWEDFKHKHKVIHNMFDVMVSYQNAQMTNSKNSNDFNTIWHFNNYQTAALLINISNRDYDGGFLLDFDYQTAVFQADEIYTMYSHLVNMMEDVANNPQKRLSEIELMSEAEKYKILHEFNDTTFSYPKDKTIHQLFEEQVERTPDNVAVGFEDKQLTYRELKQKSNSLARVLREKG